MKKIYYRKSKIEYQTGFFISYSWIIGLLILIGLLTFYTLDSFDFPIWLTITLMAVVGIPTIFLFEIQSNKQIDIQTDYNGIDINLYILKKVKKRKSIIKKTPIHHHVEIVGEYEYNSIVRNTDLLLDFYKKCIAELKKLNEEEKEQIDFRRYQNLYQELNYKIENLEKIKELKLLI